MTLQTCKHDPPAIAINNGPNTQGQLYKFIYSADIEGKTKIFVRTETTVAQTHLEQI